MKRFKHVSYDNDFIKPKGFLGIDFETMSKEELLQVIYWYHYDSFNTRQNIEFLDENGLPMQQ